MDPSILHSVRSLVAATSLCAAAFSLAASGEGISTSRSAQVARAPAADAAAGHQLLPSTAELRAPGTGAGLQLASLDASAGSVRAELLAQPTGYASVFVAWPLEPGGAPTQMAGSTPDWHLQLGELLPLSSGLAFVIACIGLTASIARRRRID